MTRVPSSNNVTEPMFTSQASSSVSSSSSRSSTLPRIKLLLPASGEKQKKLASSSKTHDRRWTVEDRTKLFIWILGPDADETFEMFTKHSWITYKQASNKLFNGTYSESAVKGCFTRSLKMFRTLVAFENHTGNGGGDGDIIEGGSVVDQLNSAHSSGVDVSKLRPQSIDEWKKYGWYDLFFSRFSQSPKVSKENLITSGQPISSDIEEPHQEMPDVIQSRASSPELEHERLDMNTPISRSPSIATVSTPDTGSSQSSFTKLRHKREHSLLSSSEVLSDWIKSRGPMEEENLRIKRQREEGKAEEQRKRIQLEEAREMRAAEQWEMEKSAKATVEAERKRDTQFNYATSILQNNGADNDLKNLAKKVLIDILSS